MLLQAKYKCAGEVCVYEDTYFETGTMELKHSGRELRLRRIMGDCGQQILLTFKDPPLDQTAGFKPEHEVRVSSFEEAAAILQGLGFTENIRFTKHCTNMRVTCQSIEILVTLVTIAELQQDFIEAEVLTSETGELDQVYRILCDFLFSLQIEPEQLTEEYYTDMVSRARGL